MKQIALAIVAVAGLFGVSIVVFPNTSQAEIAQRSARVATTACGHASATDGAGIVVDADLVLASAHVVIGAEDVFVEKDGERYVAEIVALDARTDLALLGVALPPDDLAPVELGAATPGKEVLIGNSNIEQIRQVGVTRRAEVHIEEVRSTVRSARQSFEIDERVALGESGSGVYDDAANLLGVIFGRSEFNNDRSFAVNDREVAAILDAERGTYRCNAEEHLVVRVS